MNRSRLITFVSIFFLIVVFIVLHYTGLLKKPEYFLRRILSPLSQTIYSSSLSIKDAENSLGVDPKVALVSTKEALLECKTHTANLKLLQDENTELRQQLDFFKSHNFSHIGAEVIGKNIEPLGNTLIVNRGSRDGVVEGNAVIVANGVLIGKIATVEEESSLVRLLNDNQSKIAATILNHDKSLGVIEGGYGISVRMNFIPQQEDVRVGDLIVTSGLETGMPRGLFIGNVAAVEKEAYEPFQRATLSPAGTLSSLSIVSIITNIVNR